MQHVHIVDRRRTYAPEEDILVVEDGEEEEMEEPKPQNSINIVTVPEVGIQNSITVPNKSNQKQQYFLPLAFFQTIGNLFNGFELIRTGRRSSIVDQEEPTIVVNSQEGKKLKQQEIECVEEEDQEESTTPASAIYYSENFSSRDEVGYVSDDELVIVSTPYNKSLAAQQETTPIKKRRSSTSDLDLNDHVFVVGARERTKKKKKQQSSAVAPKTIFPEDQHHDSGAATRAQVVQKNPSKPLSIKVPQLLGYDSQNVAQPLLNREQVIQVCVTHKLFHKPSCRFILHFQEDFRIEIGKLFFTPMWMELV